MKHWVVKVVTHYPVKWICLVYVLSELFFLCLTYY